MLLFVVYCGFALVQLVSVFFVPVRFREGIMSLLVDNVARRVFFMRQSIPEGLVSTPTATPPYFFQGAARVVWFFRIQIQQKEEQEHQDHRRHRRHQRNHHHHHQRPKIEKTIGLNEPNPKISCRLLTRTHQTSARVSSGSTATTARRVATTFDTAPGAR